LARQLTQQEIDAVFRKRQQEGGPDSAGPKAAPFDFRRLDRIPKSQLRAIRLLHDNFVRNLASSLSAYLRTYLAVNLVSVEQLSYAEFLDGLSSPTCLVCLGLRPYDGTAVLELNPGMAFPILEVLMGGKSKTSRPLDREITEIERNLLEGLLRIILRDLKEAWETITSIDFKVDSMETDPQMLQVLDPGEAFVATGIEVRVGEAIGMMNLAIPSLIIKMMRNKFTHQGPGRKGKPSESDQSRMLGRVLRARLRLDIRMQGQALPLRELLALEPGDALTFDYPVSRPLEGLVEGQPKFRGEVVSQGRQRAFVLRELSDAGP